MDGVRMLFGRPVKPRGDTTLAAPLMTISERDGRQRETESSTAKVEALSQRLEVERAALEPLKRRLGELIHNGEEGAEALGYLRQSEDRVHGLELALSLAKQKQEEALAALADATKQTEVAKYVRALERLKRDAQTVDEALHVLEEACVTAAAAMLTVQTLRTTQPQSFIVTCRLELERFASMAISPVTGMPKPPSRMRQFAKWSASIPDATVTGQSGAA